MTSHRIPAMYMRGGTSKGVFFAADDLPSDPISRDRLLLRVIGSPDPYGKHIDGMGGATSSTSKVVLVSPSTRPDCDVDYLFGAVAVDKSAIDWSGNCGNLSAAVGPFAIHAGLMKAPAEGLVTVRIWQANIQRKILAHVPVADAEVQEDGTFALDGVSFPAAEIRLEFLDPGAGGDENPANALFPTGMVRDWLQVPELGLVPATLINAGNPTIFIFAASLGLSGTELPALVNTDVQLLERAERIRAAGAVAMGLVSTPEEATEKRLHTPKLAVIAAPATYQASDSRWVAAEDIHLVARIFSMGQLHHAMTGTGAVAIAAAAAIEGTVVQEVMRKGLASRICFGHPSGRLEVGAEVCWKGGLWRVSKVFMSRSARVLMEGRVWAPRC